MYLSSGDFCQLQKALLRIKIISDGRFLPQEFAREQSSISLRADDRWVRHRKGVSEVTIFDTSEKVECIATQLLHYDRYSACQYLLERVNVHGKYGLACEEVLEGSGRHSKILLQPIYNEIRVRKISSKKAIYDKYAVFANGRRIADFTFVLNAWVPRIPLEMQHN